MARTKSSRGAAPFKMRSGNSPMNFIGTGWIAKQILGNKDNHKIPNTVKTTKTRTEEANAKHEKQDAIVKTQLKL